MQNSITYKPIQTASIEAGSIGIIDVIIISIIISLLPGIISELLLIS